MILSGSVVFITPIIIITIIKLDTLVTKSPSHENKFDLFKIPPNKRPNPENISPQAAKTQTIKGKL